MLDNKKLLLIDTLSKYQLPVNGLIFASKVDLYYSIDFQNYNIYEMKNLIIKLLNADLCYISSNNINITHDVINFFEKSKDFDFKIDDLIGLTSKGAIFWENEFNPIWDNYFEVYYEDNSYLEPTVFEIICSSIDLIKDIIKPLNLILSESEEIINKIDYWKPCYWKEIIGNIYFFSFTTSSLDEKIIINNIYMNLSKYQSLFSNKTNKFL